MDSLFERVMAYTVGGVLGFIFSIIIKSFNIPILKDQSTIIIGLICISVGVLISVIFMEYKSQVLIIDNTIIRNEIVALITHEMRTSLTSSGWIIGLVLKKYNSALEESDKKMLQSIIDSIHTTVMHSVNLLDVSLLDIKKLAIALEWTTLDKVETMFNEVVQKYAFGAIEQHIELQSHITLDHSRFAEVDMLRLRIVLENLLENAMQYTVGEKKNITVDITNEKDSMSIMVRDTGIGIPEKEQSKIFTEFYRASNARSMLSTGSGIGLYTSCTYIQAHRGSIRFESKEGEGTAFFVTIPLKTVADVEGFISKI